MRCTREPELESMIRGELSPEARAALETHAASCATCRPALRHRRAVSGMLRTLPEATPTELEWRRIDKHVLEAMSAAARPQRSPWSLGATAAAAMAVAAGIAVLVLARPASHPAPPITVAHVEVPAATAVAIALGGQAHTSHAPQIQEGDELRTTDGSLEIQTAPATGIALAAHSLATATRLRVGETEVAVAQGELFAEVKALHAGQSFQVRAGDLVVHVVGTAFLVERLGNTVRVAVVHGRVRVDRPGQAGSFEVAGGTEATVTDGQDLATVQSGPIATELASRSPLSFPDVSPQVVASQYRETSIDTTPEGARATVDGADRGQTPLTLLAAEGPHELALTLDGHATQRSQLRVGAAANATQIQLAPEADAVAPVPAPLPTPAAAPTHASRQPPAAPTPPVAIEPAAPVEQPLPTFLQAFATASAAYQPEVQHCYAAHGGLYPRDVHLKVAVQPNGRVAPPIASDDVGLNSEFLDCVTKAAVQWSFPVSGLSYDTTLPFNVQPRP